MKVKLLSSIADSLHRDLCFFCSERLANEGLTAGLMYFVLYVAKNPGCTPTELGEALKLDKAYVLRCLKRLISEGFFIRKPHPTDRRASLLYPTEKGVRVFNLCRSLLQEWDKDRLSGLDEIEKEQLFELLSKIRIK